MIYNREKTVPEVVSRISKDSEELKTSQPLGPDSIKVTVSETESLYDVVDTVDMFVDAQWRVTFTPDAEGGLYTEFGMSFTATGDVDYTFYDDPDDAGNDDKKSYIVYVVPYADASVSMKFQIKSYYLGELTWSRIV